MKLILSRKGFDSTAGGKPSPIFPDGSMVSLPIPDRKSVLSYKDLRYDGQPLATIVTQLTGGKVPEHFRAHLDPDLAPDTFPRLRGWRPLFGQTGAAQSHLRNQGVGVGDLFLFFGLFRKIMMHNGFYTWNKSDRPRHVIWGWLQVDEVLELAKGIPAGYYWAHYHPHCHRNNDSNNVLYVAREHLALADLPTERVPGGGIFRHYSPALQLTAPFSERATRWELPAWFHPTATRTALTYHSDPKRWQTRDDHTLLQAVMQGQEFVLDFAEYPEAMAWVDGLIRRQSS